MRSGTSSSRKALGLAVSIASVLVSIMTHFYSERLIDFYMHTNYFMEAVSVSDPFHRGTIKNVDSL